MAALGFKLKCSDAEVDDLFIYPRDLRITRGSDESNWKWHWLLLESQDCMDIEVPQLLDVCSLEIKGKFSMSQLTPNMKYELVFTVMLTEPCCGWDSPLTLSLDMPDDKSISRKYVLKNVPVNEWKELVLGFSTASASGDATFCMLGDDKTHRKKGLVVKYVEVRPAHK